MICFIKLCLFNILMIVFVLSQSGLVLSALNWVPGTAEIFSIEKPILYNSFSSETLEISPEEMPLVLPKLGEILVDQNSSVSMATSGKVFFNFEGPGSLSIDELQHKQNDQAISGAISRSIFYLENGSLILNSEQMEKGSSVIIENPLGKIIQKGGIFSIRVEFFDETFKRICTINCFSGNLKYYDLDGNTFELYAGQKLVLIAQDKLIRSDNVSLYEEDINALDVFLGQWASFEDFKFPLIGASYVDPMTLPASNDPDQSAETLNTVYFPILKPKGYFNLNTTRQGLSLEKIFFKKTNR
jgi:hypothetical protein